MTVAEPDLISAVEDRLTDVGRSIRRLMLDAMPDGEPGKWLYEPMRDYPSRPGKGLRPALCLSAGVAFGGQVSDLLGIATSIELLHNAFLVHDDVADGSEIRRGRPTLSALHSSDLALNAGNGLALIAAQQLRKATARLDRELDQLIWSEFDTMAWRTLEGQAMELGWRANNVQNVTPEDYLDLIMRKTCWYTTIHPLRVGAIVGSRGQASLAPLVGFGFHFGTAFQIRDDVLNLVGDEQYGKELLGDLYEGKRTLPLVHLIANSRGSDAEFVRDYLKLSRKLRTSEIVQTILVLMNNYGSIEFTNEFAEGILLTAERHFDQAFAGAQPGSDLDFLRSLVPYVWARWR